MKLFLKDQKNEEKELRIVFRSCNIFFSDPSTKTLSVFVQYAYKCRLWDLFLEIAERRKLKINKRLKAILKVLNRSRDSLFSKESLDDKKNVKETIKNPYIDTIESKNTFRFLKSQISSENPGIGCYFSKPNFESIIKKIKTVGLGEHIKELKTISIWDKKTKQNMENQKMKELLKKLEKNVRTGEDDMENLNVPIPRIKKMDLKPMYNLLNLDLVNEFINREHLSLLYLYSVNSKLFEYFLCLSLEIMFRGKMHAMVLSSRAKNLNMLRHILVMFQ